MIVIPAFNESASIGLVPSSLIDHGCQILVVNDMSTDRTSKIAKSLGVRVFG